MYGCFWRTKVGKFSRFPTFQAKMFNFARTISTHERNIQPRLAICQDDPNRDRGARESEKFTIAFAAAHHPRKQRTEDKLRNQHQRTHTVPKHQRGQNIQNGEASFHY